MKPFLLLLFVGTSGLLAISCRPDAPQTTFTSPPPAAAGNVKTLTADSVSPGPPAASPKAEAPPKVVRLPHGFTLQLSRPETYDLDTPLTLYSHLQVLHAGKLVYEDSTHEYEAEHRPYPTAFADGAGGTVLLGVNNRDLNWLLRLQIRHGHTGVTDTLPAFTTGPAQLDEDAPLELAGMLASNEIWGEQGEYTTYNPILYYELTPAGPVFDSKLTEQKIQAIYGQFLGFRFRERPAMPARVGKAYGAELARIAAKSKQR